MYCMIAADTQRKDGIGGLIVVALGLAAMFIAATLPTPIYPLYRRAFGFSEVALTLVYSIYVLGNLGALFFFGRLSDQAGRKFAIWPAIAMAMISTAVFRFATSIAWLLVARALSGFATGLASGTMTALITELHPHPHPHDNAGAVTATIANFSGLAVGPLISSLPAQFAIQPLRLPYLVYFAILIAIGIALFFVPETVAKPEHHLTELSLRPRFGVPRTILPPFVSPAVTAFITFSLIGFYAALIPNVLADALKESRPVISGLVIFVLFTVAALSVVLARHIASRTAMFTSLWLFIPCVALLIVSERLHLMPVLIAATILAGAAASLGYRGSLAVVNQIAPAAHKGEVVSTYLIMMYCGNSLPVIGIGLLSSKTSPAFAHEVFAGVIAVLALIGVAVGWKYSPKDDSDQTRPDKN